jgi:hypothetical protein
LKKAEDLGFQFVPCLKLYGSAEAPIQIFAGVNIKSLAQIINRYFVFGGQLTNLIPAGRRLIDLNTFKVFL